LCQLRVLEARVARRRAINARYRENLGNIPGLTFMPEAPYGQSTNWLTVLCLDAKSTGATPEDLRLKLESANIESRPVWKPMHLQPVFAEAKCIGGAVAESLFANGLCLPAGSSMTDDDVDRVSDLILGMLCRQMKSDPNGAQMSITPMQCGNVP
jgi:dTDP-4-amino-4,6-dideoxygalactose transaminase